MRPNSFGEIVGDVEVGTLVNTLHHSLGEMEAGKQGDTLRNVEAGGLADTLADKLAEVKAGKVGETLTAL